MCLEIVEKYQKKERRPMTRKQNNFEPKYGNEENIPEKHKL